MVRDLHLDVEVLGAPTVREADGLAASSRNVPLDEPGRRASLALHRALQESIRLVDGGERSPQRVEQAARAVLAREERLDVDYVQVVSARDLSEVKRLEGLVLVLISARVKVDG